VEKRASPLTVPSIVMAADDLKKAQPTLLPRPRSSTLSTCWNGPRRGAGWRSRRSKQASAPRAAGYAAQMPQSIIAATRSYEGRLAWGVNDFDEVSPLPYTADLVRLAASARLAIGAGHVRLAMKDACQAILAGYSECIAAAGAPIILGRGESWLRRQALAIQA